MFGPILWAAAAPDADASIACHEIAPIDPTGHAGDHSKSDADYAPHCPLCVLFGGTAWAPPIASPVMVAVGPDHAAPASVAQAPLPIRLPDTLRPSPRAPPALI